MYPIHFTVTNVRWLRKWGIKMASEGRQRSLARAIAPYPIEAENALFSFKLKSGGEEFRMAAIAYVEELSDVVLSLLHENKRYIFLILINALL